MLLPALASLYTLTGNTEILSYVLEGTLIHEDDMDNKESLGANEVQRISSGSGIVHSEFNGSKTEPVRFLQIWIEPGSKKAIPSYERLSILPEGKRNRFKLIASANGRSGSVTINQDVSISLTHLSSGYTLAYPLLPTRFVWLHVVEGEVTLNVWNSGREIAPRANCKTA